MEIKSDLRSLIIMNAVVELFIDIHRLKKWFIDFSRLKKYEAYKIWARWLITHMSIQKQQNIFFPTIGIENDLQILLELTNKGSSKQHAICHYHAFIEQIHVIVKKYDRLRILNDNVNDLYSIKLNIIKSNDAVKLCYNRFNFTLPMYIYDKLVDRYNYNNQHDMRCYMNHAIWQMYALYYLLDGKSLQWAVPVSVLKYLNKEFGCMTEIFASPINAYYNRYYSLYDVDKKFGSKGSFFDAPDSDFVTGCYQVNPPFIDIVFTETSAKILRYLDIADASGYKLTFIYIMPNWDNLSGFNILSESKYCVRVIRLNAGEHYYYQTINNSYIRVHFATNILILSTYADICPDYKSKKIANCFYYKDLEKIVI